MGKRLDGAKDRIGPSEGPDPGSIPGRDTENASPASVPDRTADYESARRGSIPRRGANGSAGFWSAAIRRHFREMVELSLPLVGCVASRAVAPYWVLNGT